MMSEKWFVKSSDGSVIQMTREQLEHDARTATAYAVSILRGNTMQPYEFESIASIANRNGYSIMPHEVVEWQTEQDIRKSNTRLAQEFRELEQEIASRPWWKRWFI